MTRELGALGVVAGALVAIEAVAGEVKTSRIPELAPTSFDSEVIKLVWDRC